jgi:quinol monooxygenase YgiN
MRMLVVHVFVHVKADQIEAFKTATVANATNSVQEAGIARFDFIQQADDPTKFVLVEVYRNADAPAQHKETAHYLRWRDTVAPMMAEPRQSIQYDSIFPADSN